MLTFAKKEKIRDKHFLETHRYRDCAAHSLKGCYGDHVAAHLRVGTDGGTATKPSDCFTSPLCWGHHEEQHRRGEMAFWSCVFNEDTEQLMEKLRKAMLWDYVVYLQKTGRNAEIPDFIRDRGTM
jgi:hypothetical protein